MEFVAAGSYHIEDKLIVFKVMAIIIADLRSKIFVICLEACLDEIHTFVISKGNLQHFFQQKCLKIILKVGKAIIKSLCEGASNSYSFISLSS